MCKRILVYGIVQGVGFRYWTYNIAKSLKINGYVRNLPDGSVEIVACGDKENLSGFIKEISKGPITARVDNVQIEDTQYTDTGFKITY
ncbi:acylphosphatase [Thermosipho ferrireducens]|uniref:Acylphosphatase n=1 Tax=Thermosipho ferrireducens TaxID=2571116 RepID=A0ABX7S7V0_9BACT|nr:acylphosphatase [Thermosipho ferrireducens]QTA37988.1 acylphosphatase [Thermosipho ferrireducens]